MPRQSSVNLLPPDILVRVQECLRDPRVSQLETVDIANALLEAAGLDQRITKSSLNRYKKAADKVGQKILQSREIAQMWIADLGAAPQGDVGKILNEYVRTMAFDTSLQLAEGDEPVPPKMLKDLALAIERLERAATVNVKRDEEIRRQERERAAEKVENIAKKGGMTKETRDQIRRELLGMRDGG